MLNSVKKAFVLSLRAAKLFYVLAIYNIIVNVVNLAVIPAPVDAEMTTGRSFAVIGLTILFFLISVFLFGGALAYVKELIKSGKAALGSFVSDSKKYFGRILGLSVIIFLIALILGILMFTTATAAAAGLKLVVGICGAVVIVGFVVLFIMPAYAVVADDTGVIGSIKKGVALGKNNFLKVLGVLAIMLLVAIAVMIVVSLVSGILSFLLKPQARLITALLMGVANALLSVLVNIAYMDLYLQASQEGLK